MGDFAGHPFRGNQWTTGEGAAKLVGLARKGVDSLTGYEKRPGDRYSTQHAMRTTHDVITMKGTRDYNKQPLNPTEVDLLADMASKNKAESVPPPDPTRAHVMSSMIEPTVADVAAGFRAERAAGLQRFAGRVLGEYDPVRAQEIARKATVIEATRGYMAKDEAGIASLLRQAAGSEVTRGDAPKADRTDDALADAQKRLAAWERQKEQFGGRGAREKIAEIKAEIRAHKAAQREAKAWTPAKNATRETTVVRGGGKSLSEREADRKAGLRKGRTSKVVNVANRTKRTW